MKPYKMGLDEFPFSVETSRETPYACCTKENRKGRALSPERVENATIVQFLVCYLRLGTPFDGQAP